jgi:methionyl-tRNA formyltransferase
MCVDRLSKKRYLIATFYRSGILAVKQLLNIGVNREDIHVLTYAKDRNESTLSFLENKRIPYTTESIYDNKTQQQIREFDPDILCSLYYRDRIPNSVLEIPTYQGINLHPSLLPEYAGVLSVPWAIANGDSVTGYTYHYMVEKIDDGPIIHQEEIEISDRDTAYSLYHRLIYAGMDSFLLVLKRVINQESGRSQEGEGSYHSRGALPNEGKIEHSWDDEHIDRFIRAMYYPPFDPAVAEFDGVSYEVTSMTEYERLSEKHEN